MALHQQTIPVVTEGELFRVLVESVKEYAIFIVDPEGQVQSWNPGAESLLGYSEGEILGRPSSLFCTPENNEEGVCEREMAQAVETGRGNDERWHVRKDGSRFWSVGTITPLWDDARNLRGFAKIMRDRTSQKQNDIALKDALAYAEGVVETMREPLVVLGSDLRVKSANRSFYQTFQASPEETDDKLIYQLGNGQWDIPLLRKLLEEILPLNRSFDGFEVEHRFNAIGRKVMLLNARRFYREGNHSELILLAIEDITERRRAEEERNEIETRFTSLVKNITDYAIFTMDLDGCVTSWNIAAERTLGYEEAEILGQPFMVIFTPDDIRNGVPDKELSGARETGRAENLRWHLRKGGRRFWAVGIVTPSYDVKGSHTGYSKILRDMTNQKLVEQAFQEVHDATEILVLERTAELRTANEELQKEVILRQQAHARNATLIQAFSQIVWSTNPAGDNMQATPGWADFTGLPAEEVEGLGWIKAVHPDDQNQVLAEWKESLATNTPFHTSYRVRHADGAWRNFIMRGIPTFNPQGEVVEWVGVCIDDTGRHQAVESLRLRNRAIQALSQGIVITDPNQPDNPIIYASRGFERITGYPADEVMGRNCRFLQGRETERETVADIREAIREGRECSVEMLNYRKDGTKFWNAFFLTPVRDTQEKLTHFVGVQADVTERRSLEEAFHQSQKMEAVGQLAGGVAHDFNNLLTVISGYSEIILSKLVATDPMRESVKAISEAGARAASLTRQLLAFSRKTVLEPKVVELNEVVREAEKMLRRLIGENILLTAVLDPLISRVKVDPGLLDQVLMNLLVNARDAMPKGGKLTLETKNVDLDEHYAQTHSEVRAGKYVMLAVTDSGTGMTPEIKARIFEPFFTTKEVDKGTGLGLSVVHGIVKQSGGHIEVYSELSQGTTFKLYFPAIKEHADTAKPALAGGDVRGTETILLVEDEDGVRGLALLVLQMQGYKVLAASDGRKALRAIENHQETIDLLVTDVVMPGMGGGELAEAVKARFPHIKVLFTSGYTADSVVRHGILEAEVAFMQKPYSPQSLARKVRQVLGS